MYLAGGLPSKHEDISASAVTLEQVGANQKATFGKQAKSLSPRDSYFF